MSLTRLYTRPDRDPADTVRFRTVTGEDGAGYSVPQDWPRAAIDVLLQNVFHKDALPALTRKTPVAGMPEWLWPSVVDEGGLDSISAEWRYRFERDFRDVLHRVAGALTAAGWQDGLFSGEEEARVFYDEFRHLVLHRIAAPEIALLAGGGLGWAYGLTHASTPVAQHRIAGLGADAQQGSVAVPVDTQHRDVLERALWMARKIALDGAGGKITLTLPAENADSPALVNWRRDADIRQAALETGRRVLQAAMRRVMDACDRDSLFGCDPARNKALAQAVVEARQSGVGDAALRMALDYAAQGYEDVPIDPMTDDGDGPPPLSTVISLPDAFIETALTGHGWMLHEAGEAKEHIRAEQLWDRIAEAVWASGEPALLFRDSARKGCFFEADGVASSSSGGFLFLPQSSAPAATVNLSACEDRDTVIDTAQLRHVVSVMMRALDAAHGLTPQSHQLAQTARYRPVSLGAGGFAALLMGQGIAYDSEEGRTVAAVISACLTGYALQSSAEMASRAGKFEKFPAVEKQILQNMRDRMAAFAGMPLRREGLARRPWQLNPALCRSRALSDAAKKAWDDAQDAVRAQGLRNAHLTAIDTEAALHALLGSETRDIAPALQLVGFGEAPAPETSASPPVYGRRISARVPQALAKLGYTPRQTDDICFYATGHGTLLDAPAVSHAALRAKGFHQAALDALEAALGSCQHIRYAFNKWTLGPDFCLRMLGFPADVLDDPLFDMLSALGFSEDEIEAANIHCCGAMTLEGAPHLDPDHLPVFDCLVPSGALSVRHIMPEAQVRMQSAVEPFLSGAACHTVELAQDTTIEAVQKLILLGWELGLRRLSLYRDGCSMLHPVVIRTQARVVAPKQAEKERREPVTSDPVLEKSARAS